MYTIIEKQKGGEEMKMERLIIQVPNPIKRKLDALRAQGYTASGYIRALLERDLGGVKPMTKKGG